MTHAEARKRNIEIRELYATGDYSCKDLSIKFKLCKGTIRYICKGIKRDKSKIAELNRLNGSLNVSAVDYKEAARLYIEEKWLLRQIAEKYGVSRERVRQILKKQGVTSKRECLDCKKEIGGSANRKRCVECSRKEVLKRNRLSHVVVCSKCGKLTYKKNGCGNCRTIQKEEKWKKIQKLWNEDKLTMKHIANIMNTTIGMACQHLHKMRIAGWQVDRRNKGYV